MHMNDPIADIQSNPDWRNLSVNRVGIRGLKHPIRFQDGEYALQHAVALFNMYVNLPKNIKGTHMSRFVEMLHEQDIILNVATLPTLLENMVKRLHAENGYIEARFSYFIKKFAPISQAASLMDYDICLRGILENNITHTLVTMTIPVTSLCPCSKEISDYGAHNQRSHVTVTVRATPAFSLLETIQMVEKKASCELYGILKRADEKAVTERAYNNPKFVEDMVRDVATMLDALTTIKGYKISSENFESIHNHSAYAEIDKLGIMQHTAVETSANTLEVIEI